MSGLEVHVTTGSATFTLPRDTAALSTGLRAFVKLDHQRLAAVFARLEETLGAGDWEGARAAWARLDDAVRSHMAAEERYAFPAFAREHLDEASALRADHVEFRTTLDALGVAIDLHAIGLPVVEDFLLDLAAHQRREERLFYRWAEAQQPAGDAAA